MESFRLTELFHLLGVTIFLGNFIVTTLWKALADRTGQPAVIAYAQRLVTVTDISLTATGALLVCITAWELESYFGDSSQILWMTLAWRFLLASLVIWLFALIPLQLKQARLVRECQARENLPEDYYVLSRYWLALRSIATVLPLANFYLMVFKP